TVIGGTFSLICQVLTLVRDELTLVRDALTLVGGPVTVVAHPLAVAHSTFSRLDGLLALSKQPAALLLQLRPLGSQLRAPAGDLDTATVDLGPSSAIVLL